MPDRASPLLLLVAAALGCAAEPRPVTLDAPAETLFVAAVRLEAGQATSASGLVRWSPAEGLPLFVDTTQEHLIVGFDEDQLAALQPPPGDVLAASALSGAQRCDPPLPAARWQALWPAGATGPEPWPADRSGPRLTVPWLEDRCPAVEDSRWIVEASCNDFAVFASVAPSGRPCQRDLGLTAYQLPTLRARVWYDGSVCAELAAADSKCTPSGRESNTVSCAGDEPCELSVSLTELRDRPFESFTVKLFPEVENRADGRFTGSREFRAFRAKHGYVRSMAVLEDSIWVSGRRTFLTECPGAPSVSQEIGLVQVSRSSLDIVRTTTAPPCLSTLLPASTGGFLGTFTGDGGSWIGRFDGDGRLVQSRRLGSGAEDAVWDAMRLRPELLRRTRDAGLAIFMSDELRGLREAEDSQVIYVDEDSLVERDRLPGVPPGVTWAEQTDGDLVALAFHSTNALQFVDLERGVLESRLAFDHDPGQGTHGLGYRAPFLGLAAQNIFILFDAMNRREVFRGAVSARPMTHMRVLPWPTDPNLLFVLGMSPRSHSPFVTLGAFFELEQQRFQPTVFELGGYGVPHQIVPDGTGGFYILHPWSSELTHLIPKNP